MDTACFLLQNLADEEIWKFLEGTVSEETGQSVRKHLIWCRNCLTFYAASTQRLKLSDPKRYSMVQQETLAIRKAELIRFAKKSGIEVDVTKIKTPEDFMKQAIAVTLGENGAKFLKLWETMTQDQKSEMMVAALRILDGNGDIG